ncbi:hypothetical protein BJV82DRAFT_617148 [Fennellomyces sp. T-0311]|nr:hypothetical protein BJV82DRAFT_617148 [Fennellomyces sp. T-0311]
MQFFLFLPHSFRSTMVPPRSSNIYKEDEQVSYKPLEGIADSRSTGTIVEVVLEPKEGNKGKVMSSATADHPCYYIKNENTGKTTLIRHSAVIERVKKNK